MFYYTFATLFAQLAITLRFVTASGYPPPTRLSHTQGVCRDGEEPLDRLLPSFYEFRASCFWGSLFDLFWVAARYDLLSSPLKKTSETNPIIESGGIFRPPFR
jgi:hypothetical protein